MSNWADELVPVFGVAALEAGFCMFVSWIRYRRDTPRRRYPVISTSCFLLFLATTAALLEMAVGQARREVFACLDGLTTAELSVNGRPAEHPAEILRAIRSLRPMGGHHSHPTTAIAVVVTCPQGSIALQLRRDSSAPQEYWVYYPTRRMTGSSEIGRIETSLFDGY